MKKKTTKPGAAVPGYKLPTVKRKQRTDPHRPGAIIPAHYVHVLHYNLATTMDSYPIPAFGVDCRTDRAHWSADGKTYTRPPEHLDPERGECCVIGLAAAGAHLQGGAGQCGVCSTHFVYGEVWRHEPTGEYLHLGHVCGRNYGLLADRSAFELAAGRAANAAARRVKVELNREAREAFLAAHPGLAEALQLDHPVVQDIAQRFQQYTRLSDKQVALVVRLHAESQVPDSCDHCNGEHALDVCPKRKPLATGRQELCLRVLGTRIVGSDYGETLKLLGLDTASGCKVWCTVPSGTLSRVKGPLRGRTVTVRATVQASDRDPWFFFASRPTLLAVA